jgi:ABC-2 type transport system ATP-binding protein
MPADAVAAKAVKTYSRGMRQRLAIAEILMKQASVAILDEPTGGLDPQATREFLELIRSLKHDGMTILLSSHLLDLVQSVCDRVALFNAGKLGLIGRVNDLLRDVLGGSHVIRLEATGHGLDDAIRAVPGVKRVSVEDGIYRIETSDDLRPEIAHAVVRAGGGLISIAAGHASLEDVYTQYFEGVRDAAGRVGSQRCRYGGPEGTRRQPDIDADEAARTPDLRYRCRRRLLHDRRSEGPDRRIPVRVPPDLHIGA